jgi:hypothetical protein
MLGFVTLKYTVFDTVAGGPGFITVTAAVELARTFPSGTLTVICVLVTDVGLPSETPFHSTIAELESKLAPFTVRTTPLLPGAVDTGEMPWM